MGLEATPAPAAKRISSSKTFAMGALEFGFFELFLCATFFYFFLCFRHCRDQVFIAKSEELQSAVENLDFEFVGACLEENWKEGCWWRSEAGETLLHRCLHRNHYRASPLSIVRMCRLLVEKGRVDCGARENTFGQTALHLACRYSLEPVARFLLTEAGASAWAVTHTDLTPAHLACTRGAVNIMRLLTAKEGTRLLQQEDATGLNPLYYAASRGHMDLVQFLVLSGARISPPSFEGPCWQRLVVQQNLIFSASLRHSKDIQNKAREILQDMTPHLPPELQDMIIEYIYLTTWEEAWFYLAQQ